ncbi:beta-galactosidase-1-like protein 2 [Haliotis rubra]|uniref:beta-galactosidase-1-like protein 2 n=1 Tax=Haliotis rubra TaxID=36100 RepID=UPI001EE52BAF|nr:beta-galactosidase-1-like protein 2 [Haliotis rubra]XP_046570984.1 beta-galactosidase-1-like protein 2 [Haliotis rubra]
MKREMYTPAISFRGVHVKRLLALVICGVVLIWIVGRSRSKSPSASEKSIGTDLLANGKDRFVFNMDSKRRGLTDGTSLSFSKGHFVLDGKTIKILSGAMHYFRVVPEYWKDRMEKMKSCGLNTLETYVSWNLHEPTPGVFDFEGMLDVRKYIQLAQEVGLHVIFRPGPYICSEWDFGGLPSWLLADPNMKVRSNYPPYQKAADRFFSKVLPLVNDLQYSQGGPIIAVQVENEFGSYSSEIEHLDFLRGLLRHYGITELLVTSDNLSGMKRGPFHEHALPTANFQDYEKSSKEFNEIRKLNPEFPLMVMEYWSGWFDHWGAKHSTFPLEDFAKSLSGIFHNDSSINFYMFHGGTNFGFMAGANYFEDYKPDVTSYDYDAPLDEAGNITPKYEKAREIIMEYVLKKQGITSLPEPPPNSAKADYGHLAMDSYLSWDAMISLMETSLALKTPDYMENIKLITGVGQSYGYIVYRKTLNKAGSLLKLPGHVSDRAQILLDSKETAILDWHNKDPEVPLEDVKANTVLDIVVENLGRVNYILAGSEILNTQRKGLRGDVYLDERKLENWKIFP